MISDAMKTQGTQPITDDSASAVVGHTHYSSAANLTFHAPHGPRFPCMPRYEIDLESVDLTPNRVNETDCVLITTNHNALDYRMIVNHAAFVVDARNATPNLDGAAVRIVKA